MGGNGNRETSKRETVSVLHISPALHDGGVDKLLFDYCVRMPQDIEFGFAVSAKEEGMIESRLCRMGYEVTHIETISDHPLVRYRQLRNLMRHGKYNIVHDHTGYRSVLSMLAAWREGVPCRIAHAHIAGIPENRLDTIVRLACTVVVKKLATNLFACGEDASRWMWGKPKNGFEKVKIVRNAIQMNDYRFSAASRSRKRSELGLGERFVIGNVARLSRQKNQSRLLQIFGKIVKLDSDAVLLLVGSGEDSEHLKEQAKTLGLVDNVMFLGARSDVPELLSALDVFVLPSLYEGLPVVLIEAEANGLPLVVSDTVSREGQLADRCVPISLDASDEVWARSIFDAQRGCSGEIIERLGEYDIDCASTDLAKWYEGILS